MSVTGSTSEQAKTARRGRFFVGCFFSVFLIVGLAATTFTFLVPLFRIVAARSWRSTPCTILESNVGVGDDGEGGRTYSIAVKYQYEVDDHLYVSSRYSFSGFTSTSGYEGKRKVVLQLSPGTQRTCYVNKRNPSEAVLERGVTGDVFFGLIPMIFAVVGGGGLYILAFRQKPPGSPAAPSRHPPAPGGRPGVAQLKSSASPGGRLGCSLAIALFWNGIVSIFFLEVVSGWSKGSPDGCMTVFILPFLAVGVGLLVLVAYYFLALFNPRPVLKVSAASAALGETVEIEWETSGSVDRVKSFTIVLEGREEATYRRGTSTATDKSTFATIEIVKSSRGKDMRRGKAKIAIPADTMHSFKSSNNKFVWNFQLKGDIPKWPDVTEEFPFEILPLRPTTGGAS